MNLPGIATMYTVKIEVWSVSKCLLWFLGLQFVFERLIGIVKTSALVMWFTLCFILNKSIQEPENTFYIIS